MKKTTLLAALALAVAAVGACQNAGSGNTPANSTTANKAVNTANTAAVNTAANSGTATAAKKEMADEDLSGIDAGKPLSADDLKAQFTAKPDEWKGKKVAVTGLYKSYSTSDGVNAASAYRTDLKDKDTKTVVGCFSKTRPAIWDDFSKNYEKYAKDKIVVRGVVAGPVDYGEGAFVGLEPCEIVTK
jgi:hypothetical protein